jgi:exonuclease III
MTSHEANVALGRTFLKPDSVVFCRIDYHLATPGIAHLARTHAIYKDQRFSDHAPITVDYELGL